MPVPTANAPNTSIEFAPKLTLFPAVNPGNGISHVVHMQHFGKPGKSLLGSDSHTPAAGSLGWPTCRVRSCISGSRPPGLRWRRVRFPSSNRLPQIEARYRDTQADPSEQALSAIMLERCWRIIGEMPKGQYAVAVMRWQLGMKEAEIAAVLGIAESTVRVQVHRVRRKLIEQSGLDHPFARDDPEGESS